jgi:hypothetical protein
MAMLLANAGSTNPLWLSLACEELRVFGLLVENVIFFPFMFFVFLFFFPFFCFLVSARVDE